MAGQSTEGREGADTYRLVVLLSLCLGDASGVQKSAGVTRAKPISSAYNLPVDATQVRQLYDCADFIAVGKLDRLRAPLIRLGGGGSAQQVAIYELQSVIKGTLNARLLPVYHLTDDSPYAQGDRRQGFELDRGVFRPGLTLLLFLRSWCLTPEDLRESPNLTFEQALNLGGLRLSRGYAIKFYTISSSRGVYLWCEAAEERLRKTVKMMPAQGKPNPCCPYSRPGEFGPPCPPEVLQGK